MANCATILSDHFSGGRRSSIVKGLNSRKLELKFLTAVADFHRTKIIIISIIIELLKQPEREATGRHSHGHSVDGIHLASHLPRLLVVSAGDFKELDDELDDEELSKTGKTQSETLSLVYLPIHNHNKRNENRTKRKNFTF